MSEPSIAYLCDEPSHQIGQVSADTLTIHDGQWAFCRQDAKANGHVWRQTSGVPLYQLRTSSLLHEPDGTDATRATGARVLVIDDDDAMCGVLHEWLTEHGYSVVTVPDGAAALSEIEKRSPAVIMLDLRMPVMDGEAFAREFRHSNGQRANLILLSANDGVEEDARRLGASAFIRKPFDLDEVLTTIQRCIADG